MLAPADLERVCRGLAALDACRCADWELRRYSFNASWGDGERLASMQNGSGDEWFLLFTPAGAFLKAFWRSSPRADATAIYADLPPSLAAYRAEPAFALEDVTYGGFHDGATWTLRGDAVPMAPDLALLAGAPEAYRAYAMEYWDVDLPLDAIAHVLAGKPLDARVLARLGAERTLDDLHDDLEEIGYAPAS